MQRLKGRKIVIYGATGDIGSELAGLFHEEGALLTLSGRRTDKLIDQTKGWDSTQVRLVTADATNPEDAKKVLQLALDSFGEIDVVVTSIGRWERVDIDTPFDQALETLDRHIQAFVRSPFIIAMMTQKIMRAQGSGLIVNLSSHAAVRTDLKSNLTYTPGKAGGHAFLLALGNELKGTGVRVTNLVPMIVNTAGNASHLDTEEKRQGAVQVKDLAEWIIKNIDNPAPPAIVPFDSSILVD